MATNVTSSNKQALLESNGWKIFIALFYSIIFLVGTGGNSLVIYIFGWLKRGKRKTSELLLLTLGICDLTTSILIPPQMVFMALSAGKYVWFLLGCQVIPLFLSTCITVTQMILIIICYDRYRAIVTPLKESFCWRLNVTSVIVGCILGLILDIPLIIQGDKKQLEGGICFDYTNEAGLMLGQAGLAVTRDMLSFGVMAFFIRKMLIALKRSDSFRKGLSTNKLDEEVSEFNRARKLLYAVLVVFAILIWPTDIGFLIIFIYYYGVPIRDEISERIIVVLSIIMMFQTLNSIANVFIYSAIHPDFKKILKRIKNAVFCAKTKSGDHQKNSSNRTKDPGPSS